MTAVQDSSAVLVTGASGAIGGATVSAMQDAGFVVVGFDRQPGSNADEHVVVDLEDEAALTEAVATACATRDLRHVISIAGGALPGEPESAGDAAGLPTEIFRASLEANLVSQYQMVRAVLPALNRPGRDRSITLTSSFNALSAQGMPAYSAAKAGLIGMMNALVSPLGEQGVRINVVAPGTIRTPRTERLWESVPGHFERLEGGTALGRLGRPADVAAAYVALTSLQHVTGEVLVVDGGQTRIHR